MNPQRKPPLAAGQRDGGHIRLPHAEYDDLVDRIDNFLAFKIVIRAERFTRSAIPAANGQRPEYWEFRIGELAERWGVDRRSIELALAYLEEHGLIERRYPERAHQRGGLRLRPENFGNLPRPQKVCRQRTAVVIAPRHEMPLDRVAEAPQCEMQFVSDTKPGSSEAQIDSPEATNFSYPVPAYKEETQAQTISVGVRSDLPAPTQSVEQGSGSEWANAYLAGFHDQHCERIWSKHHSHSLPTFNQSVRVIAGIAIQVLPGIGERFLAWAASDAGRLKRARGVGVVNDWADDFGRQIAPRPIAETPAPAPVNPAEAERIERELAEIQAAPERPAVKTPAVCPKCRGTGKLYNLADPDAYTPCTCTANRR